MSNDGDGSEPEQPEQPEQPAGAGDDDGVVASAADVPPTRKHDAAASPPSRPSATQLGPIPETFPDDDALTGRLRTVDKQLGMVEQVVLVGVLLLVVFVGALQALSTKLANHSFAWSFDVIRGGTFAIAMLASAYTSQQGSHISMDILTRKARPRTRLVMRVVLALVTIFATLLLVWMGLRMVDLLSNEGGDHTIPAHYLAMLIPIGGGLIIFHTALRAVIDVDYLARGKLPPERAPSAH